MVGVGRSLNVAVAGSLVLYKLAGSRDIDGHGELGEAQFSSYRRPRPGPFFTRFSWTAVEAFL